MAPLTVATLHGWTVVAPAGPPMARPPYDDPVRTLAGRPAGLRMRPALGFFLVGRQAVVTVHAQPWYGGQRWAIWTPGDALMQVPGLPLLRPWDLVSAAAPRLGTAERGTARTAGKDPGPSPGSTTNETTSRSRMRPTGRGWAGALRPLLSGTGAAGAGLEYHRNEAAEQALREIMLDGSLDAPTVIRRVMHVLGVPGAAFVVGEKEAADLPGARRVIPWGRHARAFDRIVAEERRAAEENDA